MQMNKYSVLIQKLEDDELELPSVGADLYSQLLALYLYQNELCDAKFLWKRIPAGIKADNKELQRLQQLMRALLNKNVDEFFKNINFAWSDSIKHIIDDLVERTRGDIFHLVGNAYTSILEHQLMQMTQFSREQLKEVYQKLGWTVDAQQPQQVVVLTKQPSRVARPCASSEDQLFKLTEFVSFLEN